MRGTEPVVVYENDQIVGVALPGNFCAEHEWGIARMAKALGVGEKKGLGLPQRTITNTDAIEFNINKRDATISFALLPYTCEVEESRKFHGEWDGSSARIFAQREEAEDLYAAISVLGAGIDKIAIIPSGSLVDRTFGKGGIAFVRTDLVSEKFDVSMMLADKAQYDLRVAWEPVEAMIEELRRNWVPTEYHKRFAGTGQFSGRLGWFYLGPKKLEDEPVEGSEYPFRLWLNPENQDMYDHGWYTVEEIVDWITNCSGPVVENGKAWRLLQAYDEWKETGSTDKVPDYSGICSECETLLHFGNGPERESEEFKPYPRTQSRECGVCVKCGADCTKYILSPYQREELEEDPDVVSKIQRIFRL